MNTLDFTPLFRTTVGFDRMARLMDSISKEQTDSYPPYNIEATDEDRYRITMAVAGFSEKNIEITVEGSQLLVNGKIERNDRKTDRVFLHRGIAERSFQRRFNLAEYVIVQSADLENGLLHIDLLREIPEEEKPRKIAIGNNRTKVLQAKAI